jgi:hypothetical protein
MSRKALAALMKLFLTLLLIILITPRLNAKISEAEYWGTMNKNQKIGMTLIHDPEQQLHGVYFYKKYLKDIPLEGEFTGKLDIVLREYGSDESVRGTFQLHFVEHTPHHEGDDPDWDQEELVGSWIDAKTDKQLPVHLYMRYSSGGWSKPYEDTPEVEKNVQGFYFAIMRGDKEAAAKYVKYPMRINFKPVKKIVRNKAEFLRYYDKVFTKKFVSSVAQDIPHHPWVNSQGFMLGNGQVWLNDEGKVFAINPCGPPPHTGCDW